MAVARVVIHSPRPTACQWKIIGEKNGRHRSITIKSRQSGLRAPGAGT